MRTTWFGRSLPPGAFHSTQKCSPFPSSIRWSGQPSYPTFTGTTASRSASSLPRVWMLASRIYFLFPARARSATPSTSIAVASFSRATMRWNIESRGWGL